MYNARSPAGDLCFDPKVSAEQIAADLRGEAYFFNSCCTGFVVAQGEQRRCIEQE